MDVSIIIVSYNTRELVRACLHSLYKNTSSLVFEVIVVDNNSQDRISEMLNEEFKEVKFLALPNNIGFGRANNEGIKIANGRYIFLLNPDTLLLNNAIKILSEFLEIRRDVAVCGGNLYTGDLSPTHSYMMYLPSLKGELNEMLFGHLYRKKYGVSLEFNHGDCPLEVGYITGADMMIRRDVLDEVGLFDADFFMYFEETELTWRIKKRGYKVMNVPSAKIIHFFNSKWNDPALNPFYGKDTYMEIKERGIDTNIHEKILRCKDSFASPSKPMSPNETFIWFDALTELLKWIYKHNSHMYRLLNLFSRVVMRIIKYLSVE